MELACEVTDEGGAWWHSMDEEDVDEVLDEEAGMVALEVAEDILEFTSISLKDKDETITFYISLVACCKLGDHKNCKTIKGEVLP